MGQIVELLTNVHKPGADQGEVRRSPAAARPPRRPGGLLGGLAGWQRCTGTGQQRACAPGAGACAAAAAACRPPPLKWGAACSPLPRLPQVYAQLDRFRASPDFNSYLAFIFASGEGLPIEVGGAGGGAQGDRRLG